MYVKGKERRRRVGRYLLFIDQTILNGCVSCRGRDRDLGRRKAEGEKRLALGGEEFTKLVSVKAPMTRPKNRLWFLFIRAVKFETACDETRTGCYMRPLLVRTARTPSTL